MTPIPIGVKKSRLSTMPHPMPSQTPRHQTLVLATIFYTGMTGMALVIRVATGQPSLIPLGPSPSQTSVLGQAAIGLGFGLGIVLASRLLVQTPSAQRLMKWFQDILGTLTYRDTFWLACLSSVGEELFFRGALQPVLGLGAATLLFALAHWPKNKDLLPWTLSAGAVGFCFGLAFERTQSVAAPIAGHFVINFLNLKFVSDWQAPGKPKKPSGHSPDRSGASPQSP